MTTLGLDLGGTNLRGALVDDGGRVLDERQVPTPVSGFADVIAACAQLVREVGAGARAVGIGAAGLVDRHGVLHYAPNIFGVQHARVGDDLARATGLPVAVDNDATVAAVGELAYGAARTVRDALVVTLGTGIGGGIIMDGAVRRGAHGFAAEIGHFQIDPHGPRCACGVLGHWEALASGTALGRMGLEHAAAGTAPGLLARAGGDATTITGVLVGEAALAGDDDARAILEEYAGYVAIGLAGLANVLDPERIVVSGGLVSLGEALFTPVRAEFARHVEGVEARPAIEIVPAELGDRAGVIGAAVMAREFA
ncbi:MAG: ROK family protein [Acidimicrobiia bacterium]